MTQTVLPHPARGCGPQPQTIAKHSVLTSPRRASTRSTQLYWVETVLDDVLTETIRQELVDAVTAEGSPG